MQKVTKAVIATTKLTEYPMPQVIAFYIVETEDDSLDRIEINTVTRIDPNHKPHDIIHVCSIFEESTGVDTRIITSFDGESYNTPYEGTPFDYPGQYTLDSHMDMIKFNAALLIGQDLAYKAFKGKNLYSFRKDYATSWKDMFNTFIKTRYSFKTITNEFEVKRLYRLPKSYTPIVEDEV